MFVADYADNQVVKVPRDGGPEVTAGNGLSLPTKTVLDPAGDLFVADDGNNRVVKLPADGGPQTTVGSGLSGPSGLAVDAAGDLYISDNFHSRVVEVTAKGAQTTVATGLSHPQGLALDTAGDLFIADNGNNRVLELPAGGGPQMMVGTDLTSPAGVAVDTAGDVFIAETYADQVVEVPAGGAAQHTVGTGLKRPSDVSLDTAGDLLITDTGNNRIVELPAGGGAQTTLASGFDSPEGATAYAPPPLITSGSPPPASVGQLYSFPYQTDAAFGTVTYRVVHGSLPPGLTLNHYNGLLTGRPTTRGSFSFVVEAENAAAGSLTPATTLVVLASLTSVTPASGPQTGGTPVVLHGSGLTGATAVSFGIVPAKTFTVVSDQEIDAVSPAEAPSAHYVFVTAPGGQTRATQDDLFTFTGPSVLSLSPASGPQAGGTHVVLRGSGFTAATRVVFGGVAATNFRVVSDTEIDAISPAEPPGRRYVQVTTRLGSSLHTTASIFTVTGPG